MARHNILGQTGEEAACRYLSHAGYTLLDRNWRDGHLEIDIVAEWYGEVVFVEVKTRRDEDYLPAVEAVDLRKKENLLRAARAYMAVHQLDQPCRFDIITVIGQAPPFRITHRERAFSVQGVLAERHHRTY